MRTWMSRAAIVGFAFVGGCVSRESPAVPPDASVQEVKVVIDRRYLEKCEFLKWFPYRDNVGTVGQGSTSANTRDVVDAGGNVMFLPGDAGNIGRFAAYRCGKEQLEKLPRIVAPR